MPNLFFSNLAYKRAFKREKPGLSQTLAILPFFSLASVGMAAAIGATGFSVLESAQNSTVSEIDLVKAVQIMTAGAAALSPLALILSTHFSSIGYNYSQFLVPILQPATVEELTLHFLLNNKQFESEEQSVAYQYDNGYEVLTAALLSISRAVALCAAQGLTGAKILDLLHGEQNREQYIASLGATGYGVVMAGIAALLVVGTLVGILADYAFCQNSSVQMLKIPANMKQPLHDMLAKVLQQSQTLRLEDKAPTPFSSKATRSNRLAIS